MSNQLENIYNSNYGVSVATNGNYLAIGNPPNKLYDLCEGINRIGEVYLIKKNNIKQNFETVKILKKNENNSGWNKFVTYFTEQSSSATFSSSFTIESGSKSSTLSTCSYLSLEDNLYSFLSSNFGVSVDLSDYFLAVGDTSLTESVYNTAQNSFSSVDIFKINPNYVYTSKGVTEASLENSFDLSEYQISNVPFYVITGSDSEKFGTSVSITNNYLAIGAPNFNNGRGAVYVYKYSGNDEYVFQSLLTASVITYPNQYGFGFSVCLDKKTENRLIVGSNQLIDSKAFLYYSSGSNDLWKLYQVFSENTGSSLCKLDNSDFTFYPSGSQQKTHFGYCVSIYDKNLAIGSPTDLVYFEYSGSSLVKQRGSVYLFGSELCNPTDRFQFFKKIYGDSMTLSNNLFGYSVSLYNDKLLIGSPKPYFPFGSQFISSSINFYDKTFNETDGGDSTYCGQALLYEIKSSSIKQLTSQPIGKRKEKGKPYNAFGYSVSISDSNLLIGAPIPLVNDFHLSGLSITESGSAAVTSYLYTSSYQSSICEISSSFVIFQPEESFSCLSGGCNLNVVFSDEFGNSNLTSDSVLGKGYVYDLADLKTNYEVGNVFYNNSKIVINTTGSILSNLTLDPEDYNNSYLFMDYQSEINLFEKQYICTIEPGEFNISTNPSALNFTTFDYGIENQYKFDFNNLDIILRYINFKLTSNSSEKWWLNFVSGDYETSVFNFYSSSIFDYNENKLTYDLKKKCSILNFDVNDDGTTTIQDATIIWKYFIENLTPNNFKNYLNPRCKRTNYNDIISFLDNKTGKFNIVKEKPLFFNYNYSSSIDPTGSYLAPYITTVGLYAGSDLVAIAKLAQPIKNTGEIPINIVVKWDI